MLMSCDYRVSIRSDHPASKMFNINNTGGLTVIFVLQTLIYIALDQNNVHLQVPTLSLFLLAAAGGAPGSVFFSSSAVAGASISSY